MSRLDYEFAPIDVSIMTHPKAFKAGIEAMGLWMWGVTYAKVHRTNGVVHRDAALGALGGKDNVTLAKRLVDAGLWLERADGDFDIWNHAKKAPKLGLDGKTAGAKRTAKWRKNKAANDASPVTSQPVTPSVTSDVSASISLSVSPSSGSSSGGAGGAPPEWFLAAIATADQAGCPVPEADIPARWVQYQGSASNRGLKPTQAGAGSWLVSTIRGERAKAAREAERDAGRKGAGGGPRGDRQPHDGEWLERMKQTGTGGEF